MIEVKEMSVGGKTVFEVEDHHHVLIPWAEMRERLGVAPHVVTLDHHTDTLPAFTHYDETHETSHAKLISDRTDRGQIENAIRDLRHDEHFDFAIRNGIIRSAAIFSHENFSRDVNPSIVIIHDPPPDNSIETRGKYYATTLEDSFLEANLRRAPLPENVPYLLDIDLDCFKGEKSAKPDYFQQFIKLIQNAAAITVSRERDWVRLLNLDYGRHHWEYFAEALYSWIKTAEKQAGYSASGS